MSFLHGLRGGGFVVPIPAFLFSSSGVNAQARKLVTAISDRVSDLAVAVFVVTFAAAATHQRAGDRRITVDIGSDISFREARPRFRGVAGAVVLLCCACPLGIRWVRFGSDSTLTYGSRFSRRLGMWRHGARWTNQQLGGFKGLDVARSIQLSIWPGAFRNRQTFALPRVFP